MLIVKKFGGTSLRDTERIKKVVEIIKKFLDQGHKIVIIVSAKAGMTDGILKDLENIGVKPGDEKNSPEISREIDQAVICGESLNAALVSCALNKAGIKSISFNAYNLPIYGSEKFFDSEILEINKDKILSYIKKGFTPVITGFQAVNFEKESCLSLGRGGSDYSAVIFSAAINADECDIYTDVEGIFDADPNLIENAKKIENLTYDEAILITSAGAKVLQNKSAIAAKKYNVNLKILSSFLDISDLNSNNFNGTTIFSSSLLNRDKDEFYVTISSKKENNMEENQVSIIFLGEKSKLKSLQINSDFQEKLRNFLNLEEIDFDEKNFKFCFFVKKNEIDFKNFMNTLYNFCNSYFKK